MTTAIVGVGNIGSAVARHLVAVGESVVLAAKDRSRAQALAEELGSLARAASGTLCAHDPAAQVGLDREAEAVGPPGVRGVPAEAGGQVMTSKSCGRRPATASRCWRRALIPGTARPRR
jgi:NAD(P)-dependent dehydrogenase (short-subunit alcohol dehydrogenase family)